VVTLRSDGFSGCSLKPWVANKAAEYRMRVAIDRACDRNQNA
jgi:hypothetical protein